MIMIFQRNLIFQNPQEQLEQLREQRRQLAQLQRTAAAPTTSRRESFRFDCGHDDDGIVDDELRLLPSPRRGRALG